MLMMGGRVEKGGGGGLEERRERLPHDGTSPFLFPTEKAWQ